MKYGKIYVCADGSEQANEAMELALRLGEHDGAELVGCHVYAAKLHDQRFRAMEGGLPAEYQEETELERQRAIHDSLITEGLELITDSYLEKMATACRERKVPFTGVSLEGRNWQELVKDIDAGDCDLVAMGGHGIGRVPDSLLGTVTERVLRRVRRDVLISKTGFSGNSADSIVVCLDGSSRSWGALIRAIELARSFDKKLVALSAFDPYFHYTMFGALKGVLSDEASKVFKFEQQEKLHEDIIDSGLAKIYQSHLGVAERVCEDESIPVETHLLDGKPFEKILEFVRKDPPWLLVMGRIGIHSDDEMDIGGTTGNLCRLAQTNILVVETSYKPSVDYLADEAVSWTKEAEARMKFIPEMARGVATQAVKRHCLAEGHTVITSSVLNAAIRSLLPPEAIARMGMSFDDEGETALDAGGGASFRCTSCGYVHHGMRPTGCPVCGRSEEGFELVEPGKAVVGVSQQTVDGRELVWEKGVLRALEEIQEPVKRQRVRAKLEKRALTERRRSINAAMLEEVLGQTGVGPPSSSEQPTPRTSWTDTAVERIERVPAGFMRKAAMSTIEQWASEKGVSEIDLEVVEEGLLRAREKMRHSMEGGATGGHGTER